VVATTTRSADELAAPRHLLLTSSAVGMAERMMPNTSWSRLALNLAKQPGAVASRAAALGRELVNIGRGRSGVAPAKGDKRFADPAWRGNPLLKRTMQGYLATTNTVNQLFSDANLDWRDAERMRFVLDVLTEGLSPSNNPMLNPQGWKALTDTGGLSAIRGSRHLVADTTSAPRVPSMVETRCVHAGRDGRRRPGVGGFANRGVRADSVCAANRQGLKRAADDGATGDQQVLPHGYLAGSQHDRVFRSTRDTGLRGLMAQSHSRTPELGIRPIRPGDPERTRGGREDDSVRSHGPAGIVFRRDSRRDDRRASQCDRRGPSARRVDV
jgi:Poly-beta-hydroxybutyrate polymerase (PhaC) N-terminus